MVCLVLVVVLGGLAAQLYKHSTRVIKDSNMRERTNKRKLNELKCVHEILACLVEGVYARDKGEGNARRYWVETGYAEMDINQFASPDSRERIASDSRDPHGPIRLMVFKRCDSDDRKYLLETVERDDTKEPVYVPAPKYVVAIRGTMNWKDMVDNMHILCETICGLRTSYGPVMEVIRDVHDKCSADGGVCVTGHSLGAMLALVATRLLATEEQIVLESHLFNPPFISWGTLPRKMILQVPIGLQWVLGKIPVLGSAAGEAVRGGAELFADVNDKIVTAMSEFLLPQEWASADEKNDQLTELGYCPHLYVNEQDSFGNEYIRYFKGGEPRPTSFTASGVNKVAQLFHFENKCAQSCHRIPQAYLHTNHWGQGKKESHALHQWFLYPPVGFTSEYKGRITGETS